MTEEELQAILAEHGGERGGDGKGRHIDPAYKPKITSKPWAGSSATVEIDNPTPPNWIIVAQDGTEIHVQPQQDGTYTPIKVPKSPTARAQAPATVGPQGGRYWDTNANNGKGGWVEIPPTAGARTPTRTTVPAQGGRIVDENGAIVANVPPTQQAIDEAATTRADHDNAAALAWANFFRQQAADSITQAVAQGQLTETQASNVWGRLKDTLVGMPQIVGQEARATEATRQQGASNQGRYGMDVEAEGRAQGQNAADDTKYLAEHAVGSGPGGFTTDMPDLAGARRRAVDDVYNRLPGWQQLYDAQPEQPYFGSEDLAATRALMMPWVFGGNGR